MAGGAEGMDADARVALAEIRGDVKLVLAGQDRTNADVKDLRERVHVHGNRLQVIEAREDRRVGAIGAVKGLWAVGGFSIAGALALILRHFSI